MQKGHLHVGLGATDRRGFLYLSGGAVSAISSFSRMSIPMLSATLDANALTTIRQMGVAHCAPHMKAAQQFADHGAVEKAGQS